MPQELILSIDQSTTSTKAILFDQKGALLYRSNENHKQYYPKPGYVEHDPIEIFNNCMISIKKVLDQSRLTFEEISALAVTNQRETTVLWDGDTGKPVHNALVWQDNRSANICTELEKHGFKDKIKETTGLIISPYFCAPKAAWMVHNIQEINALLDAGRLMFGTIDSWLIWNLTGGKSHVTDYSNASRTMLFNLEKLKWDVEMISIFGLEKLRFPEVVYSDEVVGYVEPSLGFSKPIPICGVMGDSHAALFGQQCFQTGMVKATYGTGSSIMMNTGNRIVHIGKGLVDSIGWGYRNEIVYVIEGNINFSGDTIKWLVEDLKLIPDAASSARIAESVADNGGVFFIPAFAGLGAPYWDSHARASINGITRDTKQGHIVRAALESIAYQIKDIIEVMKSDSSIEVTAVRVDGGASKNDWLMQFQADILNTQVVRLKIEELSALGVAMVAMLAKGMYDSPQDMTSFIETDKLFKSQITDGERRRLYKGWQQSVQRALTR